MRIGPTQRFFFFLCHVFFICFRHSCLVLRFVLVAVYSGRQLARFVLLVYQSSLSLVSLHRFLFAFLQFYFFSFYSPRPLFQPFLFPFSDVVHGFHIESFSNIAASWSLWRPTLRAKHCAVVGKLAKQDAIRNFSAVPRGRHIKKTRLYYV